MESVLRYSTRTKHYKLNRIWAFGIRKEPFDAALSKARTVHQLALMHFSLKNNLKTKKNKERKKKTKK